MPFHDGFHGWIGLNTALYKYYVELNPFIGVHVVPVEKLWSSLKIGRRAGKYDRGNATYAVHIGEIAPDEDVVRFTLKSNIRGEAERLARLCAMIGMSYARSIADYDTLLPLLKSRVNMLGGYPERVACCLYLMGRFADAREFAVAFLAKEPDYFEGFAKPFLRMIEEEDSKDVTTENTST